MSICLFTVPGTIKNYSIYNKNGWKLKWSPPDQTAGQPNIRYYEIEWTINNELHSKNVSFDKNYFEVRQIKVPDIFYSFPFSKMPPFRFFVPFLSHTISSRLDKMTNLILRFEPSATHTAFPFTSILKTFHRIVPSYTTPSVTIPL